MKIWQIPKAPAKSHGLKYSLVYVKEGERIIGYDNAEGKGDHRHYLGKEILYTFKDIETLIDDFNRDLESVLEIKK